MDLFIVFDLDFSSNRLGFVVQSVYQNLNYVYFSMIDNNENIYEEYMKTKFELNVRIASTYDRHLSLT